MLLWRFSLGWDSLFSNFTSFLFPNRSHVIGINIAEINDSTYGGHYGYFGPFFSSFSVATDLIDTGWTYFGTNGHEAFRRLFLVLARCNQLMFLLTRITLFIDFELLFDKHSCEHFECRRGENAWEHTFFSQSGG